MDAGNICRRLGKSREDFLLGLAFVFRLALICFGAWQDAHLEVPFTDIDYSVYTDAAMFMNARESPYKRSTYRYTPLLAGLLLPNCALSVYGKILFSIGDILAAQLMLLLLSKRGTHDTTMRCMCLAIWLFSPFTATISTRGNGESIVTCMLLGMLLMLQKGQIVYSALLYGLSVHWRIYPIIYSFSVLKYLASSKNRRKGQGILGAWLSIYSYEGLVFGLVSGSAFILLGGLMYAWYGMEFLDETYLYHFRRVDPRHNFSPYFYPAYLFAAKDSPLYNLIGDTGFVFGTLSILLQIWIGYRMGNVDLVMAFFSHTIAFVAFNKVSTAQYFVWYLSWLPLAIPVLSKARKKASLIWAGVLWSAALCHWLGWAYFLEMKGAPVYLGVWMAGLVFLFANTNLLVSIMNTSRQALTKVD